MRDSEALLRLIFSAADRAGVDQDALCESLGCTSDLLTDPSGRYPHELQPFFWSAVEQITGDDEIGLTMCRYLPGFDGHSLEYALLSSATLRTGIGFFQQNRRLLSDAMHSDLLEDDDGTRLTLRASAYSESQYRHTEIIATYAVVRALRTVPFSSPLILRVELALSPRRNLGEYETVFGCPVSFDSPTNVIWLADQCLDRRLPLADPNIAELHRQVVAEHSAPINKQDLLDRLRAELYERCNAGFGVNARLSEIAGAVGTTDRQLREALADIGTSFRALVSETRVRVVERLLTETDAPLNYIARAAGFADTTALSRAFGQTRGMPPLRFRRQMRAVRECGFKTPGVVIKQLCQKAKKRVEAIDAQS